MSEAPTITHDQAANRFTAEVEGHTGFVEYEPGDGMITITHTVVPKAIGGRGIAGHLVAAAVDYASAEGLKVAPRCSYAAEWFDRHPDRADVRV